MLDESSASHSTSYGRNVEGKSLRVKRELEGAGFSSYRAADGVRDHPERDQPLRYARLKASWPKNERDHQGPAPAGGGRQRSWSFRPQKPSAGVMAAAARPRKIWSSGFARTATGSCDLVVRDRKTGAASIGRAGGHCGRAAVLSGGSSRESRGRTELCPACWRCSQGRGRR